MSMRDLQYISQRGFSLVELMIGLVVGLFVIIVATSIYLTTIIGARDTINSAKLNMEIRGAMDTMAEDIRRAGFGGAVFMSMGGTDLAIYNSGGCIVYSYDSNADGSLATASPFEYFGFRVQNNTLQMRNGGAGNVSNCTNGDWEALTDPNTVQIETPAGGVPYFAISYNCLRTDNNTLGSGEPCVSGQTVFDAATTAVMVSGDRIGLVEMREVTINLPAHLASDATMRINLSESVAVRNHRVVTVP